MDFYTQNPATGQKLNSYKYLSFESARAEILSLDKTQKAWARLSFSERQKYLEEVIVRFQAKRESLTTLVHNEMGKSLPEARAEFDKCLTVFPYYFEKAPLALEAEAVVSKYSQAQIHYEPLGLVFSIMPWNFPMWQVMRFAVPALMAGNLVVLKHSDITAGVGVLLEDIFKTSFGSLLKNCHVNHETAALLMAQPQIRAVTFTGSSSGGKAVAKVAGENLKKSVLELGGMDAYLVLKDANLKLAAQSLVKSRFGNCGQSCVAAKRFVVEGAVAKNFIDLLLEEVKALKLAPLATARFQQTLHQQVQQLQKLGGKLIAGGTLPEGVGAFYPATVVVFDSNPVVLTQECFGPVGIVQIVEDFEEALKVANESPYGLGGGVFTEDSVLAQRALKELQAGFVVWNDFVKSEAALPFGGVKDSGYGRELGRAGLMEFVNIKTIAINEKTSL